LLLLGIGRHADLRQKHLLIFASSRGWTHRKKNPQTNVKKQKYFQLPPKKSKQKKKIPKGETQKKEKLTLKQTKKSGRPVEDLAQ